MKVRGLDDDIKYPKLGAAHSRCITFATSSMLFSDQNVP